MHERDRAGVQDFVLLENYESEAAFIDNLKKRFQENLIYVSIKERSILFLLVLFCLSHSIFTSVMLPLPVDLKTGCWKCVRFRWQVLVLFILN